MAMPFRGVSVMEQREGFVMRALEEGANIRGLCRAYGISPTTGYRWLGRYRAKGSAGLDERSRRPYHSPKAMPAAVEEAVVALRRAHPCWGGRKIHHVLRRRGLSPLPHANTITDILHRHGLIAEEASAQRRPFQRFERVVPNELWQMDFKGHFATAAGRCHPLTVLDDHSRYAVTLVACANERRNSVQPALSRTFERYGMPQEILIDNGPPWGKDFEHRHTKLTAWLMRLGIKPIHGRPYHPQTRGKNERFNGTLAREGIGDRHFRNLAEAQRRFDAWRHIYNYERPHQGIGDEPPASRFRSSTRRFPAKLPPIAYGPDCLVRRVQDDGRISWGNRNIFVSSAFAGEPIGLRPTGRDGIFDVLYCSFVVSRLDLTATQEIQK
jgi:transposase InsO family protein